MLLHCSPTVLWALSFGSARKLFSLIYLSGDACVIALIAVHGRGRMWRVQQVSGKAYGNAFSTPRAKKCRVVPVLN
jgi:hypothetical protein